MAHGGGGYFPQAIQVIRTGNGMESGRGARVDQRTDGGVIRHDYQNERRYAEKRAV